MNQCVQPSENDRPWARGLSIRVGDEKGELREATPPEREGGGAVPPTESHAFTANGGRCDVLVGQEPLQPPWPQLPIWPLWPSAETPGLFCELLVISSSVPNSSIFGDSYIAPDLLLPDCRHRPVGSSDSWPHGQGLHTEQCQDNG